MRLSSLWKRYDRALWVRVAGTISTTVTSSAIRPFLAVYLYDKTGSIYLISIILGLAPLMGVITNFAQWVYCSSFRTLDSKEDGKAPYAFCFIGREFFIRTGCNRLWSGSMEQDCFPIGYC